MNNSFNEEYIKEEVIDLQNPLVLNKVLSDIEKAKIEKRVKEELEKFSYDISSKLPKVEDTLKNLQNSKSLEETKKIISEFKKKMATFSLDDEDSKKQVGRNAYEIRTDVLSMAIDWLKLETNQPDRDLTFESKEDYKKRASYFRSGDAVIDLAQKFYKFVENKR